MMKLNQFRLRLLTLICFILFGSGVVMAQKIEVQGTVHDAENNEGLPGVNIVVKGTATGLVSDPTGKFGINVPQGSTLVFSFLGYITQEVKITDNTTLSIKLTSDVQNVEEVVVVGYGKIKKSDLTGAISTVKAESFKEMAKTGFDQAMQGRASGVMVTNNTGAPGSGVSIRIRGVGSIAKSNEPLYIIDGIPIDNAQISNKQTGNDQINTMSGINPDDIERFEVLKDPASCAIYGARGANGVVLITTKHGTKGANQLEFSSYYGMSEVANKLDLLNSSQYQRLVFEGLKKMRVPLDDSRYISDAEVKKYNTNWQDQIFRQAPTYNVNLSARGGSDKGTYYISGGYFSSDGIVINTGIKRYTLSSNTEIQLTKQLKVGANLSASRTTGLRQNNSGSNAAIDGNKATGAPIIAAALASSPAYPILDSLGRYAIDFRNRSIPNPVMLAKEQSLTYATTRILASAYLDWDIAKGLSFKNVVGTDLRNTKENFFWGPYYFPDDNLQMPGSARTSDSYNNGFSWVFTSTLNYMKDFGKHSFTILAGHEASRMESTSTYVEVGGMPVDYVTTFDASPARTVSSNSYNANTLESYFGRVNYNYDGKYLLQVNMRRDGSSRFGQNSKWGVFPAASLGWNVARENFLLNQEIVSEFKPRISIGVTGNQNIGDYAWRGAYRVGTIADGSTDGTVMNYLGQLGGKYTSISDYGFSWEESTTKDLGIDLGLFNNRISISADVFERVTDKLILDVQLPATTGVYSATNNAGKLTNKGYEFSITTHNLTGKFKWTTDFNISGSRLIINKLISDSMKIGNNILIMGKDLQLFTYEREQQVDSVKGFVKLKDLNGDGVVSYGGANKDRTIFGSPLPRFFGGLNNTFTFKGVELSVFMQFVYGNKIYNAARQTLESLQVPSGQTLIVNSTRESFLNRWLSKDVTDAAGNILYPRNIHTIYPTTNFAGNNIDQREGNSGFVEDGSYLRVKNVSLGYNIPKRYLTRLHIMSAKVYMSATNLLTFTKYTGFDPEVNSVSGTGIESNLGIGTDNGSYPQSRTFTLGFNMTY